jgi:anti-sigma factor RsiW
VSHKGKLANPTPKRAWTRPDDYIEAMARKRTARRARGARPRTQPESPRLLLSTLPILAVLVGLGVLAVAIMVAAFPGSQPVARPHNPAAREQGVAARGWFQDAQKDMRR